MHRFLLLKNFLLAITGLWILLSMSSCSTNLKKLIYMQGSFDTTKLSIVNPIEPTIRKGDILSIVVYSDNPEATKIYNQSLITTGNTSIIASSGVTQAVGGSAPTAPGYQVDLDGNIVFQGIGKLHVEGLTKAKLKDTLDARLIPYLQNPYYNIRFLNYTFTMLGEVVKPGIITIPGERINMLDALALAGDLTFFGNRKNVTIIRETNNKRTWCRMDLTSPDIMLSPYYYLQQNDIVVVEPTNSKLAQNDVVLTRNLTVFATLLSTFAIFYSIFHK
jgi:polysaccharide biosynthesis/export protein